MNKIDEWEAAARIYAKVAPQLDARLGAMEGLSLSDLFALRAVARSPLGHLRIQALAEEIGLSPSATSRLVTRLEGVGLLRRFICDTDRRGMYTAMTGEGLAKLAKAEETYAATVEAAMNADI